MISRSWSPTAATVPDVGGKGASLFRLAALGQPVPPFFVITAEAMRAHGDGAVSPSLRAEVAAAWRELGGEGCAVAVRSSSLAEDSVDHSFAGVFDTVLGVRGLDAVVAAIEQCWSSHRGAAASAYRDARQTEADAGMAVVVQRMVDADWSGVCFTADPITQALSVMVVNATPGLGERLVSGLVTPEEIQVDRRTRRVISRQAPDGRPAFPAPLLAAVTAAASEIAEAFGFPQDLEWAVEADRLQLLQSRPITTLAGVWAARAMEPWGDQARPDDPVRVWTRAYADEIWTPPVSPLFYDLQNLSGQIALQLNTLGDHAPLPPDVFKYHKAAPYLDSAQMERLYVFQPRSFRQASLLGVLPPERREAAARAPWNWRGLIRRTWQLEVVHGPRRGFTRNHSFLDAAWTPFEAAVSPLLAVDESALSDAALDQHLQSVWGVAGSIGADCGIAVFYYAHDLKLLLTALLDRWFGDGEARYAAISGGLAASVTVRESDAIWLMARRIRAAGPTLAATALQMSWSQFAAIADAALGPGLRSEFDAFLASHRQRGANYKDPIHPRWGDDPELLWRQVQAYVDVDTPRPSETNAISARARQAAQAALLADLRGVLALPRRALLRFLFKYHEIYMGLRDGHRFYYDHIWWLLRRIYREKGRRLRDQGHLSAPEDVFFLVRKEIDALSVGTLDRETAAQRVAIRRREWEATRLEQPPKFLRRGYLPDGEPTAVGDAVDQNVLSGTAASAGQVRGAARVIHDVAELGRLRKGEILVTRQTDPAWTPSFARLGGLVLETGGVLAHGASLCREFGVPCVTAVERATLRIRDGDMLLLDGGQGVVRIVEEAAPALADAPA